MPRTMLLLSLIAGSLMATGCQPDSAGPADSETAASTVPADTATSAALTLTNLKAADLLDGKEDKVIGKCYVCMLSMDGKPEHEAEYEGYKVHLCSEHCLEHFQENAESVVAETEIPASDAE